MKTISSLLIILSLVIFVSCDKSNNDAYPDTIANTEWTLLKIIDNQTGGITEFPDQLDKFHIIFKQPGVIELPDYCNYSFGSYNLSDNDAIVISNVGPGTEMYCLPELAMDWEVLFINALREAETYSIEHDQLTITSSGDYNLGFDFVKSFGNDTGKILFYTNSGLINCPFAVEISLNNTVIDTLTAASTYSDTECECDDETGTGLLKEVAQGSYMFYAREINCTGTNRVNTWLDEVTVKKDSCSVIFLDVTE